MTIIVKGMILRKVNLSAGDKLLTIFTAEKGILLALARHVGNKKSRLAPCCEPFSYSEFCLEERKGNFTVSSAELIRSFFAIREDLFSLALAGYFLDLTYHCMPDAEQSPAFLRVLLNTLHLIEKKQRPLPLLKAVFELRVLSDIGFAPDVSSCLYCGREDDDGVWFLPLSGRVVCRDCFAKRDEESLGFYFPPALRKAVRHIINADIERLFSFYLDEKSIALLSDAVDRFARFYGMEKSKSLNFYNSLQP